MQRNVIIFPTDYSKCIQNHLKTQIQSTNVKYKDITKIVKSNKSIINYFLTVLRHHNEMTVYVSVIS